MIFLSITYHHNIIKTAIATQQKKVTTNVSVSMNITKPHLGNSRTGSPRGNGLMLWEPVHHVGRSLCHRGRLGGRVRGHSLHLLRVSPQDGHWARHGGAGLGHRHGHPKRMVWLPVVWGSSLLLLLLRLECQLLFDLLSQLVGCLLATWQGSLLQWLGWRLECKNGLQCCSNMFH